MLSFFQRVVLLVRLFMFSDHLGELTEIFSQNKLEYHKQEPQTIIFPFAILIVR